MKQPFITLNDNTQMPQVGFGTWQIIDDQQIKNALAAAIKYDYKHIDTAQLYNNEYAIGDFMIENQIDPQTLYITTKVWISNFTSQETFMTSIKQSLKRLNVKKVNLILLHWALNEKQTIKAYKWLETAKDNNLTDSIGVSNFNVKRLQAVLQVAQHKPVINQIQFDLNTQQQEVIKFCQANDIAISGYSLLKPYLGNSTRNIMTKAEKDVVDQIAIKHHKTGPQVILKFALQQNIIIFPKSINPDRIKANIDLFDFTLDPKDMQQLKAIDKAVKVQKMDEVAAGLWDQELKSPLLFKRQFTTNDNGTYKNDETKIFDR